MRGDIEYGADETAGEPFGQDVGMYGELEAADPEHVARVAEAEQRAQAQPLSPPTRRRANAVIGSALPRPQASNVAPEFWSKLPFELQKSHREFYANGLEAELLGEHPMFDEISARLGEGVSNIAYESKRARDMVIRKEKGPSWENREEARAERARDMYAYLTAHRLGMTHLVQAESLLNGDDVGNEESDERTNQYVTIMSKASGENAAKLFGRTTESEAAAKTLENIETQSVQDNLVLDAVLGNRDGHAGQYFVHENRITKVDNSDYLRNAKVDNLAQFAASSWLAGMPQAHELLTPTTMERVEGWNVEAIANLLRSAVHHGGSGGQPVRTFTDEQIATTVARLHRAKRLVLEARLGARGLTGREFFDAMNAERYWTTAETNTETGQAMVSGEAKEAREIEEIRRAASEQGIPESYLYNVMGITVFDAASLTMAARKQGFETDGKKDDNRVYRLIGERSQKRREDVSGKGGEGGTRDQYRQARDAHLEARAESMGKELAELQRALLEQLHRHERLEAAALGDAQRPRTNAQREQSAPLPVATTAGVEHEGPTARGFGDQLKRLFKGLPGPFRRAARA